MKTSQDIIDQDRSFYRVNSNADSAPLRDYLLHGYESRREFYLAVQKIVLRWRGRIGERIGEKYGFLLLRFHDTPGGKPDKEWIPKYLLTPTEPPMSLDCLKQNDDVGKYIDAIYGFD